jgi:hypothetical protein
MVFSLSGEARKGGPVAASRELRGIFKAIARVEIANKESCKAMIRNKCDLLHPFSHWAVGRSMLLTQHLTSVTLLMKTAD